MGLESPRGCSSSMVALWICAITTRTPCSGRSWGKTRKESDARKNSSTDARTVFKHERLVTWTHTRNFPFPFLPCSPSVLFFTVNLAHGESLPTSPFPLLYFRPYSSLSHSTSKPTRLSRATHMGLRHLCAEYCAIVLRSCGQVRNCIGVVVEAHDGVREGGRRGDVGVTLATTTAMPNGAEGLGGTCYHKRRKNVIKWASCMRKDL